MFQHGELQSLVANNSIARCFRCDYIWTPRKEPIRTCAKCRSPYWDKARNLLEYNSMRLWSQGIVNAAKKYGHLGSPGGKCVDCNNKATCWEHRNYARPLKVEPVCHSCNLKRGNSTNKI